MQKLIEDQRELVDWLRVQTGKISIAVAFWGEGALDDLQLLGKDVRIILELASGGSNPSEVEKLMAAFPGRVKALPRLHAKAYITANEALVGSANASASGLCAEGAEFRAWTELGLLVSDRTTVEAAQRWFESQWAKKTCCDIDESMLARARKQWARNRASRPYGSNPDLDLLSAAIACPDDFKHRPIYVVVTVIELSARGEQAVEQRSFEIGRDAYGWERWPDIPRNALLIAFTDDEDGLQADSPFIYRTLPEYGKSLMKWVDPIKSSHVDEFRVPGIRHWKQRLLTYKKRNLAQWNKDGVCVPICDFVKETTD